MQSTSTAYRDAIAQGRQTPLCTVTSTVLGDLSQYVAGASLDSSLTTDLPAETRLVAGYVSAKLTLELTGDPENSANDAAWLWSPYNSDSPFYGLTRIGADITVHMGYQTVDGPETVPVFTGQVTRLDVNAGQRTATLEALDGAERLRGRVDLPQMVGSDPTDSDFQPGLNSQAILERILATGGFYAAPPPRSNAVLAATLHGSTWPQVGDLLSTLTTMRVPGLPVPYAQGRFGLALTAEPGGTTFVNYGVGPLSLESGSALLIEAWIGVPASGSVDIGVENSAADVEHRSATLSIDSAGVVTYTTGRPIPTVTATGSTAVPADGQVHYVAVYAAYAATSVAVQIRVDGVTTSQTVTMAAVTATPTGAWTAQVGVSEGGLVEAVQIAPGIRSPVDWSDSWSPTLLMEPGLSELVAPPTTSADDAWALAQQVVAAEYGTLRFDPTGRAVFWNRQHWRKSVAANTVQRTITTIESIMDMSSVEIAGAVRTQIRVPFQPLTILPVSVVWQQTEQIMVPARGEVTRNLDLGGDTVWAVDTTGWVIPAGGALSAAGQNKSGYRAARRADGSGGQVTTVAMDIVPSANTIRVTWINPEATDVWLVTAAGESSPNGGPTYPTSSVGKPSSQIVGKRVTKQAPDLDTSTVDPSRPTGAFTEAIVPDLDPGQAVLYTAPDSPWRQSGDAAQSVADDLLRALYRAMPQIQGLSIVADPALEPGDRVQVEDPNGLRLNEPFWIAGLNLRFDSGGMTQTLTLRPVAAPGQFIFGVTGRDVLNETPL